MVARREDQDARLQELHQEELDIRSRLNKLRVYGAYKGRHSKVGFAVSGCLCVLASRTVAARREGPGASAG